MPANMGLAERFCVGGVGGYSDPPKSSVLLPNGLFALACLVGVVVGWGVEEEPGRFVGVGFVGVRFVGVRFVGVRPRVGVEWCFC